MQTKLSPLIIYMTPQIFITKDKPILYYVLWALQWTFACGNLDAFVFVTNDSDTKFIEPITYYRRETIELFHVIGNFVTSHKNIVDVIFFL